MAKEFKTCDCCGARLVEYKHVLNAGLVDAFVELSKHAEPTALTELDITRNQWTNFQKLRYWGLVENTDKGTWFVTKFGHYWMEGRVDVQREVWTFRGNRVRFSSNWVSFSDVYDSAYRKRDDYVADAVTHEVSQ